MGLGQMHGAASRAPCELLAASDAVIDDDRTGGRLAHGWEQRQFTNGHRQFVRKEHARASSSADADEPAQLLPVGLMSLDHEDRAAAPSRRITDDRRGP
jgi:hypothetical protein